MLLQFVVERDANTLLPQFLGMYRITLNKSETYLVVMRCVFSPDFSIHCKYDLKATTISVCVLLKSLQLATNYSFSALTLCLGDSNCILPVKYFASEVLVSEIIMLVSSYLISDLHNFCDVATQQLKLI